MTTIKTPIAEVIKEAADILKNSGLVAMPTETVYGLAANALDDAAVAKVFEAKGRPAINPLICHIHSAEQISDMAEVADKGVLKALSYAFWPGPLTLILTKAKNCKISPLATAGLDTIAVRIPSHPIALALLNSLDFPLVAPSANRSGKITATTPALVAEQLGESVNLILAAGAADIGLESTVLDLTGDKYEILRPGAITKERIEEVLGQGVGLNFTSTETPKSPGQLLKHYAPNTPLRLNAIDVKSGEALLAFGSVQFMGIEGGGAAKDLPEDKTLNLSESGDLEEAASNLFAMLNALDKVGARAIAVMSIPETGVGIAINDRLRRAASI